MNKQQANGAAILLQRLRKSGFFHHYSLLGDGNLRSYDWEKMSDKLAGDTRWLWRFFLLGEKAPRAAAVKLLGEPAVEFLTSHKLARPAGRGLTLGHLSLASFGGFPFFVDQRAATLAYFGQDIVALLKMQPQITEGNCLCLHPASGVEVLPLAVKPGVSVSLAGTGYHPGIIAGNLALNSVADRCQWLPAGWKCAANSFDLITGSIPSLFEVPGLPLPARVSGGPDGLTSVKHALALGSKGLRPGGEMVLTFLFFAPTDSKAMGQKLKAAMKGLPLSRRLIISSKVLMEPGLPLFNQMLVLTTKGVRARSRAVIDQLLAYIRRKKFGAVYLVRGRFWKDEKAIREEIIDYSDVYYGGWTF
jgi:hypothetical protein